MEEEGSMTNGESEQSGNSGDTDIEPFCESDKTVTPKSGKSSKKKSKSKKGKSKVDKSDTCKSVEDTTKRKSKAEKELSRAKIVDRLEKFGLTGLIICGELVDAESIETNSCCQETASGGRCEELQTDTPDSPCCSVSADCDNIPSFVNSAEDDNCANKDSLIMGDAESKESKKTETEKVDEADGMKSSVDPNGECIKNASDTSKLREKVLGKEEENKTDENDENVKPFDNKNDEMMNKSNDHSGKDKNDVQPDEKVTNDDKDDEKETIEDKDEYDEKTNTDVSALDEKIITEEKNNGKLNTDYASDENVKTDEKVNTNNDVDENDTLVSSSPCDSNTDELKMSGDEAKDSALGIKVNISELNIKTDQNETAAASKETTDECVELNDCEHVLEDTKTEEIGSNSMKVQTCDVKNNDTQVVQNSVDETATDLEAVAAVTEMPDIIEAKVKNKAEEISDVQTNANDASEKETNHSPEKDEMVAQAEQNDNLENTDLKTEVLQITEEKSECDKVNEHVDKDENENVGKTGVIEDNILTDTVLQCDIYHDDKNLQLQEVTSQQNVDKSETTVKSAHASDVCHDKNDVGVQTDELMTELVTEKSELKVCKDTLEIVDDNPSDSAVEAVDLTGTEQEWDQVMGLLETSQAELEEVTARGETCQDNTEELEKEEDKADTERQRLEEEVERLKSELASARSELHKSQSLVRSEQGEHNRTVMTLKRQLYRQQVSLRKQRDKSEQQMGDVMSHLLLLEGRLKKEQQCLRREMQTKDELINVQANEVLKLRNQNEQLLNAIQEICAKGGMNGYLREKKKKNEGSENGGKHTYDKKDKKGGNSNGKLGSVKDKFLWKNRSSLELNSFNLEKYLIKNDRLCTSQEDLQNIGKDMNKGVPNGNTSAMDNGVRPEPRARCHSESVANRSSLNSHSPRNSISSPRHSQNYFSESEFDAMDMNKSTSESSQLSENSSGVYSMSDQDIHSNESYSGHYGNDSYYDEDEGHFSFSSTHINMAIAEEDVMGPVVSHTGSMTSMGSMPILSNDRDHQMSPSDRGRPHSLTSVDFHSLEQHAQNLQLNADCTTPPHSPSSTQGKSELTPFQTFKTMFKRKGSKNKGSKKRAASLSTTTNIEYSEALKKHFQKYDMS